MLLSVSVSYFFSLIKEKDPFSIRWNDPILETSEHNFETRVNIYIQDAAVLEAKRPSRTRRQARVFV